MGKQWNYFHRTTEQQEPMSVLVDAAYSGSAPLAGFTRLLSVVVNLYAIAADKGERAVAQSKLGSIERRLDALFAERLQAVYVGRINTETRLEFYYYAKPGELPHRELAAEVMSDYPSYRWIAAERDDAEWTFYTFLQPNEIEKLYAKNRLLLQALLSKGDRPDVERDVFHWLRFASGDHLRKAADRASALGYSVVNVDCDAEKPAYPHTLIVSRRHALGEKAINESVKELYELVKTLAGRYEGWGADVRRKLWRRLGSAVGGKPVARIAGLAAMLLLAAALIAVPLLVASSI